MSERAADALATYWDDLTIGLTAEPLTIDPALADAVGRFHRAADVPGPEPEFVARLERALASSADPMSIAASAPVGLPAGARLASVAETVGRVEAISPPTLLDGRARRALAHLATAALLLLTLAAGYLAIRGEPSPSPIPGGASRDATPDPASVKGLLLQATVAGVPPVPGYIGIDRWRFSPHSGMAVTAPPSGPSLYFVVEGRVTARFAGAGQVTRGVGATTSVPIAAGASVELAPGDGLIVPANVGYSIEDDQSTAATLLGFSVLKATATDQQGPTYDEHLIQDDMLASDNPGIAFPPGPTTIEMRRAMLAPGESVPAAAPGTYQLVGSETKPLAYLVRGSGGQTTNKEAEWLSVVIVTTRPASPASTPAATRAPTG